MCGICGTAGFVSRDLLAKMCQLMYHRGPDDEGIYVDEAGTAGLGMRRLSIIDLATGHQPIHNEDRSLWLVLNGEIYNHCELREILEKRGHRFYTASDTESIVHLYEEYGEEFVGHLRGMFAFALWDRHERRLLLVRDRLGIKPLYYALQDSKLVFASELKALLAWNSLQRGIDPQALDAYLSAQYIPAPLTIFQGIRKMLPGSCLIYENGELRERTYWQPGISGQLDIPEEELPDLFLAELREAVQLRLISDVPLGAFLSGGIDSSTVVALMAELTDQPVKTFSVGFAGWDEGNELPRARAVAAHFGCEHHDIILEPNIADLLHRVVWHLDEPLADPAAIPTFLISRFARDYVTVVLTGEGADELCAGYKQYAWDRLAPYFQRLPHPVQKACRGFVRTLPGLTKVKRGLDSFSVSDIPARWLSWTRVFSPELKQRLYTSDWALSVRGWNVTSLFSPHFLPEYPSEDVLNRWLYMDTRVWLPDDLLMKVDKMSMAASLEARVPFLDHKLVEFAWSIPSRLKLRGWVSKYLLKRAASRILPPGVVRQKKHGFNLPLDRWFRYELRGFVADLLLDPVSMGRGYFDSRGVQWLLEEHWKGQSDYSRQIYTLVVLELWHRAFCDSAVAG